MIIQFTVYILVAIKFISPIPSADVLYLGRCLMQTANEKTGRGGSAR